MYSGDEIYGDDVTSGPLPDALEEPDDDPEDDEEQGYNVPTLYLDGTAVYNDLLRSGEPFDPANLERVQLEFDATANGVQSEADERAPLGWCNSATIHLDRDEDSVTVLISVGDPRGAFAFTVRRINGGDLAGKLIMHTPYPGEPMPHMELAEIRPGTYEVK